jgi:hypothetical protein
MHVRDFLRRVFDRLTSQDQLQAIRRAIGEAKMLAARSLILQMRDRGAGQSLSDVEFKVSSQFGDDGIIQFLIAHADLRRDEQRFIEFGVENYQEANTRFLLQNDNWTGLVIDGSERHIDAIRNDRLYWRQELTAIRGFIDRDNVNELFETNGFSGPIGLLSIDIDGCDYWVWQAIRVVDPVIVIVEYNSVFGLRHAITVPYDPTFVRSRAHPSNLYWGASLRALHRLADEKGYSFLGCNSNGNNAYFVRSDRLGKLRPCALEDGYVVSRFRESRDARGRLSYLSGAQRLRAIGDMPVYDTEMKRLVSLKELEGWQGIADAA